MEILTGTEMGAEMGAGGPVIGGPGFNFIFHFTIQNEN